MGTVQQTKYAAGLNRVYGEQKIETGGFSGRWREISRIIEGKKTRATLFIFEMIREISSNLPTKTQVSLQYRDFCGEEIHNWHEIWVSAWWVKPCGIIRKWTLEKKI